MRVVRPAPDPPAPAGAAVSRVSAAGAADHAPVPAGAPDPPAPAGGAVSRVSAAGAADHAPAPAGAADVPAPPGAAVARAELRRRRDRLAAEVAELQWALGGLTYEMAIRDHFRLDVLLRRAAMLQERDAELAEVERLLR